MDTESNTVDDEKSSCINIVRKVMKREKKNEGGKGKWKTPGWRKENPIVSSRGGIPVHLRGLPDGARGTEIAPR